MDEKQKLVVVSVLIATVAFAALSMNGFSFGCSSTSCQKVGDGNGALAPSGTASLDVWANYTGGAFHFSKQSSLTLLSSVLTLQGKTITAITVKLSLSIANATASGYGGDILVYTCGACGDQQVSLGQIAVTGAVTEGSLSTSSFPVINDAANLTLLVWPSVTVTLTTGQKMLAGMSPVAITNVQAGTPTAPAPPPVACPATLPIQEYIPGTGPAGSGGTFQTVGTATLLSATQAAQVFGVSSYNGLLATYSLGSFSIFNVIIPGMGGSSAHPNYGLLTGYHYTSTGACESY